MSKAKRVRFWLQPTKSFPEGAPQREEYNTDRYHDEACERYAAEWRAEYECTGCDRWECPQHGHSDEPALFDADGNYDFKAMAKCRAGRQPGGGPK